jgi:phage-related protein
MHLLRMPWKGKFELLAVCRDRGDCLLLEFFDELEANLVKDRDRMVSLLEKAAVSGPPKHNTDASKRLDDGVYEFIRGSLRVLWFYDSGRVIVCTHGFVKKGQKTPRQEIETAKRYMARYQAAKRDNTLEVSDE